MVDPVIIFDISNLIAMQKFVVSRTVCAHAGDPKTFGDALSPLLGTGHGGPPINTLLPHV